MKRTITHKSKYLAVSLAASALLSLFLVQKSTTVQADVNSQAQVVQTNKHADFDQNGQPTVEYYQDYDAKPNDDRWPNASDYSNDAPVQFLGINDVHGNIDTTGTAYLGARQYRNSGTAERLAGYLDNAEKDFQRRTNSTNATGNTFRVEAGDMVGASPAMSSLLQDEPTMKVLKAMGINIGTLGNHEFDEGLDEFNRILTGGKPKKGQFNQLEENYPHEASGITMVVSNVTTDAGKTPFNWVPYLIKSFNYGGHTYKVGFIGVVTTDMPSLTFDKNLKGYKILDEADTIAKYEKLLRQQGVNAIVVLAHTASFNKYDKATKKTSLTGASVDILKKLYQEDPDNSVDLYIAAHSHWYTNGRVGHTKIVQADSYSRAFDDVVGYLDPKTDDFVPGSLISHVYPVLSAEEAQYLTTHLDKKHPSTDGLTYDANDPSVKKVHDIVANAEAITQKITEAPIGKGTQSISKAENSQNHESQIGDLVVDSELATAKAKKLAADFAITNAGGVRAGLQVEANGDILWKSAQAVQPFGNRLQINQVTGQQLLDLMNSQGGSRWYMISGGKYVYTDSGNADHPLKSVVIYDSKGQAIDPKKNYNLVVSNYLADSVPLLHNTKKVADLGVDTDTFIDYIKSQKTIAAPQTDRKEYVTPEKAQEILAELARKNNNSQPSQPTQPTNPVEPTKPVKPSPSVKPEQPAIKKLKLTAVLQGRQHKIRLMDEKGHYLKRYYKSGKKLHFDAKKKVKGHYIYRLAGTDYWLAAGNLVTNKERKISGKVHLPLISGHPHWRVHLLNSKGRRVKQTLRTRSNWKVFGVKLIRGQVCYRLGNQNQWILGKYVRFR
jgi:5'-nucleotidase